MIDLRFMMKEAREEFVAGLKEPMVPLLALGLVGYLAIVLMNADYMRDMGATNIYRNAPHVVFLMTAGQGFWLFFAWAWLFSRVVSRDRDALLNEIVLSTPTSLKQLMVARYVGAALLASLLGLVSPLGFLIVHPLDAIGALPAGSVGPTPWGAMAWAWIVLALPSAFGMGALYVSAAFRTRSSAGPFAVAGAAIAIWMVAMVVVRSGSMDSVFSTVLDPTAYAEAEDQSHAWTPKEKMTSYLAITGPFLVNRFVWCILPIFGFAVAVIRLTRESLLLGTARKEIAPQEPATASRTAIKALPAKGKPTWWRATLSEAAWHLRQSLASRGAALALGLLFIMGIAGSFVHVVAHGEGPLIPRPEFLMLMLSEFSYMIVVFMIAGFVGALMRRDERLGFGEMLGAAPAPLWVRVLGRASAATGLTLTFATVPLLSGWAVTALSAPESFSFLTPLAYTFTVTAPALLEVCAVAVLFHALFRSPGTAHGLTLLSAFIMVVNHEIHLVTYPPAQLGIPAHVAVSELGGWAPWTSSVAVFAALKLSLFGLAIGLAWFAWQRVVDQELRERWLAAAHRLRWGASALTAISLIALWATAGVLHDRLVVKGEYIAQSEAIADDAAWEKRFAPSSYDVDGGNVRIQLHPEKRKATVLWELAGVRSADNLLQGELASNLRIERCEVDGEMRQPDVAHEHFQLPLGACAADGCGVSLALVVEELGWPLEASPPRLLPSQVWATAEDLLPRLGTDPARQVRSPQERAGHGLTTQRPRVEKQAAASSVGVTSQGRWNIEIECPEGWCLTPTPDVEGPLSFAVAWLPHAPQRSRHQGIVAWHGKNHTETALEILEDVHAVQEALASMSKAIRGHVNTIVQVPRGGHFGLHGGVLWLPEDRGWDVAPGGVGQQLRRFQIAREIAATEIATATRLRREPGSSLLTNGFAGWLALETGRMLGGDESWRMLVEHEADRVVEAFGTLDAPVTGLATDGDAPWVESYAPLSLVAWSEGLSTQESTDQLDCVIKSMGDKEAVQQALERCLGREIALALLGAPRSSDASLNPGKDGLEVASERWRWIDNDWQISEAAESLIKRGRAERMQVPSTVASDVELTVIDAWPSFERSISDNVWPREGSAID